MGIGASSLVGVAGRGFGGGVGRTVAAATGTACVATETVVLDDAGAPTEVVETVTETVVEEVPEAPTDSTD